jgi:nucleotide-binding universal stress UspA family protein
MPSRPDNTAENLRDDEIGVVSYDPTRILIPTDGSATAIEATNVAIGLAKRFGAEVVAVFVDPGHAVEPIEDDMIEALEGVHHSMSGLSVAERCGDRNGVKVKPVVAHGATAQAILTTCTAERCDMIVMGKTGRTGIQHVMLGSLVDAILHDAEVPVLVVKHCSTQFCMAVRTDA